MIKSYELKNRLAHVMWLGGATDTGKSTIAQNLASRYGIHVYHYDKTDVEHHDKLARTVLEVRQFLDASLDERWVHPEPEDLLARSLKSFSYRFPLVIEDLLALPGDKLIIAEGFGLLPELVHLVLSSYYQAIWLVPTETFKLDSMERRGKPAFGNLTSNPEKAKTNLFTRDMMLVEYYRKQVLAFGYTLVEVDGSRSAEEMTNIIDAHFAKYHNSRQ